MPEMTDDMTDAIVHNYISGFNNLPTSLVPDMTIVYRVDIWRSNPYTPMYPAL